MQPFRLPSLSGKAGARRPPPPARGRAAPVPQPETQGPEGQSGGGLPRVRGAATRREAAWGVKSRGRQGRGRCVRAEPRSEEHTSELQSLMRISYAVFCLKKKKTTQNDT